MTKVGTNRCRALHTNHKQGRIWEAFSSDTYKAWEAPNVAELEGVDAGGVGYYRNYSLLSVWAHAPFAHNNAIGPEICSQFYGYELPCVERDPSVVGRVALFEASMQALLYPESRPEKISTIDEDLGIELPIPFAGGVLPVSVVVPKRTPVGVLGNLDIQGFVNAQVDYSDRELQNLPSPLSRAKIIGDYLRNLFSDRQKLIEEMGRFVNCNDLVENKGHTFGTELSDREKRALIEFMKTL